MISLLIALNIANAHPHHTESWEDWSQITACQEAHDQCHDIFSASPRATRNPEIFRFSDPSLQDAKWTTLHLLRLQNPNEPLETRLALLNLVFHSQGEWEEGVLFLLEDPSPEMRTLLVQSTKFGSATFAETVLNTLSKDEDPTVRATVYRMVSRQNAGQYTNILRDGLKDDNPEAQLSAIRSIGWSKLPIAISELTPFLNSEHAELRLHSLRTIHRIAPETARSLPQLKTLLLDSNPKVAREAERISQGNNP